MAQTSHNHHKRLDKKIGTIMYGLALLGPIMTLPQVIAIWQTKDVGGFSLLTWGTYLFLSVAWLLYGMYHQEKPLIVSNVLYLMTNTGIIAGILLFRV